MARKEDDQKEKQKRNFDRRHAAQHLPTLQSGDQVWIPDRKAAGRVLRETQPRSYLVDTPQGQFRRNRRHLVWEEPLGGASGEEDHDHSNVKEEPSEGQNNNNADGSQSDAKGGEMITRSGRQVRPPQRLDL
jgi:hypothetical protein